MPGIINTPLDSRSWILVRDRIGQIVKDELFNQAAITYNDWLNCDVFTERWAPVTPDECKDASLINITIKSITPENEKERLPEIRITGVSPEVHRDLIAISKNEAVNLSDLLKPKLREIRDSYPDYMRKLPD